MNYRVKIKDLQPLAFSVSKQFPKKCFLGISLSNPFFHGRHLEKVLKWIDENFEFCIIVIADHLHRFNEYTFKAKNTEDAEKECLIMGKEIHNKIEIIVATLHTKKFEIYHWLSFTESSEFLDTSKKINLFFAKNENFRISVLKSCEEFIEKQINRGFQIHVTKEEAIDESKKYLLEEMAVFSILIGKGYTVQIYPGTQLKVLKELANKGFIELNTHLTNGIYIDLTVKKIRK